MIWKTKLRWVPCGLMVNGLFSLWTLVLEAQTFTDLTFVFFFFNHPASSNLGFPGVCKRAGKRGRRCGFPEHHLPVAASPTGRLRLVGQSGGQYRTPALDSTRGSKTKYILLGIACQLQAWWTEVGEHHWLLMVTTLPPLWGSEVSVHLTSLTGAALVFDNRSTF